MTQHEPEQDEVYEGPPDAGIRNNTDGAQDDLEGDDDDSA